MSKYICASCSYEIVKWMGRCPKCSEWNTFITKPALKNRKRSQALRPINIGEINYSDDFRYETQIAEIDRVLGGGLVKGSLVLLGGWPGVGKSTLVGELLNKIKLNSILYVSGEESERQIGQRFKRLKVQNENLEIACESKWEAIRDYVIENKPELLIIDSIQTTYSKEIPSSPGSVAQIKDVTYRLMTEIKARGITCIVIGHINKDGAIAGPKILEHMVDTVLYFEGDKGGQLRILRAIKNRFGVNNEIGLFEMTTSGLKPALEKTLLTKNNEKVGCVLSSIIEGSQNIIIEIQTLVSKHDINGSRRLAEGMDLNRLLILIAILEKNLSINISSRDIYLNVTGGFSVRGGDSDLTVLASLLSSIYEVKLPTDMVFLGEVGLCGEIRAISKIEERIKNFRRLGIRKVIVSSENLKKLSSFHSQEIVGLERVEDLNKFVRDRVS